MIFCFLLGRLSRLLLSYFHFVMLWHICRFKQGPYVFGFCPISALFFVEFKGRCLCVVFSLWCFSCTRVCFLSSLLCSPFGTDLYQLAGRGWPTATFSVVLSGQRSRSTCRSTSRQWLSSHTRQLYLFLTHRRIVCVSICIGSSSFWDIGVRRLRWQCLMFARALGLAAIGVRPILSWAQGCGGCGAFWLVLLLQSCGRLEGAWFVGELRCRGLVLQALATALKALVNRAFVAGVRRYRFSCWWLISYSLLLICNKWITCLYLINRLGHLSVFGLAFCLWVFRLTLIHGRWWRNYLSRNLCKRVFRLILSLLRLLIVIFLRLNLLFWLRSNDFNLLDRLIV